jgi:hypothetical protein
MATPSSRARVASFGALPRAVAEKKLGSAVCRFGASHDAPPRTHNHPLTRETISQSNDRR